MAPGNNERHPGHTGTIPKTKARNNCNVPQEAVTPTRRDMASNLVTTSLDWVPVSEYNTRSNYNQSRKQSNNTSDHELTDLDNSVSFESGFGRFVPVRPQPRALPLNVQNRENLTNDHHDDAGSSVSGHTLHPYAHQMQNGLNHTNHTNHAAAAVMIVNPTTPNAITANMSQPFNAPNQNRKNHANNLNPARNNLEGMAHSSNNNPTPPILNTRSGNKTVNLMNNMYDQAQSSFNNINENTHVHRESARALGEAIVAACPDTAAVERRLGQIREYIRVTSSLVDTMRNSEDEAFIEHTKEEYDELVEMVMKLKESETNLEKVLNEEPDNLEVPAEEADESTATPVTQSDSGAGDSIEIDTGLNVNEDDNSVRSETDISSSHNKNLKKVTNIENEQLNKNLHKTSQEVQSQQVVGATDVALSEKLQPLIEQLSGNHERMQHDERIVMEIKEIETVPYDEPESKAHDRQLNEVLRKNILSCVEKVALIEEMKNKNNNSSHFEDQQEVVVRPVSVQSNGSAYSENELWQNEIKNKMELSQLRLTALKQQQKRLLKYQEEAKQQIEEMNRERHSQEVHPSTSHDNFGGMQNHPVNGGYHNANRMYAANQIGVATTLPHSTDAIHGSQNLSSNIDAEHGHSTHSNSQDDRFSHRDANIASSEEAGGGGRDSEVEEDEGLLSERGRMLQMKLRELQLKKQHMENLVSEFQKMQMATHLGSSNNTYSSSGEDSGDEEPSRKCNKSGGNIKNEDPFKLMEIKAIKTALQKTKDLMRSVENYESDHLSGVHDDSFQVPGHSNIHDNKSEGGGSMGGWSNEGSVCRVRNSLPQRHKFTNEQHSQQQMHHPQQHLQHPQQHLQHPQQQQMSHETNIASLQELAQELRMETEKIVGERARIKDMMSNKDKSRKQKKVNEEVRASCSGAPGAGAAGARGTGAPGAPGAPGARGAPGPAERRQLQLRALLADKQRELEAILNKEKVLCSGSEAQKMKPDSRAASIVNQSYNSEQEDPDSRSEQILLDSQNSRETDNFRVCLGARSVNTIPSQLGSAYCSDSDSASRTKSNQRSRARRRQPQDRLSEENNVAQSNNSIHSMRHEPRVEPSSVNMVPPIAQNLENPANVPYPHLPPPYWNNNKSNQDMRTNQFTQNSHSQTMERLLGTPQMSFPPSMPFNMMMPYGMVGGCSCGCGFWGAWCWQQLAMQQQEIRQLRDQLNHLEERWRAETASHTLNNQVPPGNRANNYWDNFRSYSRQNLLSANSKTNADGHLHLGGVHPHPPPHPLVERSHNSLHRAPRTAHTTHAPPRSAEPKRNTDGPVPGDEPPGRPARRNLGYERSLSFSSAPDVLNLNQNSEQPLAATLTRPDDPLEASYVNRQDAAANMYRNLNIANPIPEIIQSHSNNLNAPPDGKRKSSSKLPAKNSTNRRNLAQDYSRPSDVNVASSSRAPNPNLASDGRQVPDKAASKLFDLLRENVYSEVTALIGVNESHPDFLIQLFRELQLIGSDPLRQKVLQSIRNVLSQYSSIVESRTDDGYDGGRAETVTTTSNAVNDFRECPVSAQEPCSSSMRVDEGIVRFLVAKSDEICTPEILEALAMQIISCNSNGRQTQLSKKKIIEFLTKYEGTKLCNVSNDIIENLVLLASASIESDEGAQLRSDLSDSAIMQDVAGSLNLFSSSDSQLHQLNACPYEMWPGHVHLEMDSSDLNENSSPRSSQEGKVDLINCSEMHNGDLAEADQTCPTDATGNGDISHDEAAGMSEALPDVVDTEEATPTEAEAEWLGLDRVPTRLHMEESSEKQKD